MTAAPCWIGSDGVDRIKSALATEGSHLFIYDGGWTLYVGRGIRLSAYNADQIKADCNAAGLPIIDTRGLDTDTAISLAYLTPAVAVGIIPDTEPYDTRSYAPLRHVADIYRAAGAEVLNLPARASA